MMINSQKTSQALFSLFVGIFRYSFLTGTVLLLLAPILIISLIIYSDVSFDIIFNFVQKFSWLDSRFLEEDVTLENKDIMKIFSVLALIFAIIGEGVRFLLKKYTTLDFTVSIKTEQKVYLLLGLILYGVAGILEPQMIPVLIVFFFVYIICSQINLAFKSLQKFR